MKNRREDRKNGRDHLRSLQQWVCELLVKNQELRMALESETAQEKEKQDG